MAIEALAGNKVVANTGDRPLVNYNFMLRVEGLYDLPCKSIHGFQKENEYEYIQEGGLNDYVHIKRKPISKPFTFEVERYVGSDYFDPMPNGAELILPVILLVSRYTNKFDKTKRTYVFTGCTVTGKKFGDLTAEQSGLLVETTTIAYRQLVCIDTMWDDLDTTLEKVGDNYQWKKKNAKTLESQGYSKDNLKGLEQKKWEFPTTSGDMEGKGEKSRRSPDKTEIRKDKMFTENKESSSTGSKQAFRKAILQTNENSSYKGDKRYSANLNSNEVRKQNMKTAAYFNSELAQRIYIEDKIKNNSSNEDNSGKSTDNTIYKQSARIGKKGKNPVSVKWEIDKTNKNFKGKGIRRARVDEKEVRKKEMQAKSTKWSFSKMASQYKGMGIRSAHYDKLEVRKSRMPIRSWKISSNTKEYLGLGNRSAKRLANTKTKKRLWTNNTSAKTQESKKPEARLWPDSASAKTMESKKPEARLWPPKRSARSVADFLSNH